MSDSAVQNPANLRNRDFEINGETPMANVERVKDEADPRRCQAVTGQGQCMLVSVEGTHYCMCHGGASHAHQNEQKQISAYRLKRYQSRLAEFSDHDKIKSLRDEIGILRILLEERLNVCNDTYSLMMHSSAISDLVMKIDKLVNSCHRLEAKLGLVMDEQQTLQFCDEVIEIIGRHVEDPEALDCISQEIAAAISRKTG